MKNNDFCPKKLIHTTFIRNNGIMLGNLRLRYLCNNLKNIYERMERRKKNRKNGRKKERKVEGCAVKRR